MKKLITAMIIGASILFTGNVIAKNSDHKVYVCHVPAGNPSNAHTIYIDVHAAKAHIDKHGGDYYGECRNSSPAPTGTPVATATPEPSVSPQPSDIPTPSPTFNEPRMTLPPTDTE